jgi:phosphoglycolate phosphatase
MVSTVFPGIPFETVRGALEGVPLKPDPTAVLAILKEWEVTPSAAWFVGDTATDMHTARNGGLRAAGVLWGFRDRQELESAGAEILAANPRELTALR